MLCCVRARQRWWRRCEAASTRAASTRLELLRRERRELRNQPHHRAGEPIQHHRAGRVGPLVGAVAVRARCSASPPPPPHRRERSRSAERSSATAFTAASRARFTSARSQLRPPFTLAPRKERSAKREGPPLTVESRGVSMKPRSICGFFLPPADRISSPHMANTATQRQGRPLRGKTEGQAHSRNPPSVPCGGHAARTSTRRRRRTRRRRAASWT